MKRCLQSLIAFILVFAVSISAVVQPVYAAPATVNIRSSDPPVLINGHGDNNSISISNSFNRYEDKSSPEMAAGSFTASVVNGFISTAGVAVGGAVACYVVDGVAAAFFPPVAAAASLCPGFGALAGGAKAIAK